MGEIAAHAAGPDPPRRAGRPAFAEFDRPLLLLALLLTVCVLAYFWTPTDPDVWWHLANGQFVAQTGTVPHGDIYSYTVPGARWIMQQWLLETVMYGVEQGVGYWANVLLFGLASAAVYTVLFGTLRGRGAGRSLAAGMVLVAMVLDAPTWGVRPQIWTTLFFVSFLAILLRYRRVGPDRRLWLLPPLMLLWANFHAGFSAGLLLLGAFIAGEALNRLLGWPAAPLRPLLAAGVACAAVSLLNPNGWDLWLYPLTYLSGPNGNASLRFVQEWQPPDLRAIRGWPFLATLLALLVLNLLRRPGPPTAESSTPGPGRLWGDASLMIALAGFTTMALQALRFLPLYAIIWAVVAAGRLAELGPPRPAAESRAPAPGALSPALFGRLNLAVYLLMASLLAAIILTNPRAQIHPTPAERDYPAGAVAYLDAQRGTLPAPVHLFHDYGWGGYLIAHHWPVFVDGRADPYNTLLDTYVATSAGIRWQETFARYGVNGVLVQTGAPLDKILQGSPGWNRAYRDATTVLYIKQ
ncbi:MAG TPA: hypothetical protein VKY74_00580 [Chloroflexia bacterium]|nr:hypothetical protein [Chloroflexia bacterium]